MAVIKPELYAQLSEAAQAEGYSDQELQDVLTQRGHTIESAIAPSQPPQTEQPVAPQQPGVFGQAVQQVENVYPFIKPVGEALGALGKRSSEGLTQMREEAEQAFPPNPDAMIKQDVLVTAAKGLETIGKYAFPKSKEEAYVAIGGEFAAPVIPEAIKAIRPTIARAGARLMKATAGVPEKYGMAVINNPDILTRAETREVASEVYKKAIGSLKGAADYLKDKTGKLLMKSGSAEDLVNDVAGKLESNAMPQLQEVLAARQANEFLLSAAKFGNPEQRANLRNLMKFKEMADEYLEAGLPGFKDASRGYFEANAKEAFSTILPQNKNLSPNALRTMGALATFSSGAWLHAPYLMLGALPASPKLLGFGIRGANQAVRLGESYAAQFAARIAAMKAVEAQQK